MAREEVSDEMLMALADGELPETEAAGLHARIRRDPEFAARYEVFAETRRILGAALDPGPVPARLVGTILETPMQAPPGATVTALRKPRLWPGPAAGAALAASLLLAVGIGGFELGRRVDPGTGPTGTLAAVQALAAVPTGGEARLADGGVARALGSFDTSAGLCRLIATEDPAGQGERIVACRDDGRWRVILSVAAGDARAFVTASDAAVELVDGILDRLGAGPALDPDAEAMRLRNGGADRPGPERDRGD